MDTERFRGLVDAYGADPRRWPEDERAAMEAFRGAEPPAEAWLHEARELDGWLDRDTVTTRDLSQQILRALPQPFAERLVAWLLPREPGLWWRPAVAAALPVVFGVAIGMATPTTTATDWTEEEQALLSAVPGGVWYE